MKLLAGAACAALIAGTLAACGGGAGADGRTSLVASFYPAAFLAEQIGGDDVDVSTLTSPGAEPHDLEMTAKQVVAVNEADVVVYLSDFQTAVDEAVEDADRSADTTVDIGAGVTRLEETEVEEQEDDHEDHDHGHTDPHVWLDTATMEKAADSVRDALIKADPDHRTTYEQNATALVSRLKTLGAAYTKGLATCERRDFVTSHAAFGYLARAYNLHQIPISGVDPQSEPSTKTLAQITHLVEEDGITTIFTERLASSALADTVARETGATTAVLDPIEGLTDETSNEDYVSLMEQNLAALQKANGCS